MESLSHFLPHPGNATICRPITNPTHLKDTVWATQTCPLGFSVFGVWSDQPEGSDISCIARSHNSKLLVTGDDCGEWNPLPSTAVWNEVLLRVSLPMIFILENSCDRLISPPALNTNCYLAGKLKLFVNPANEPRCLYHTCTGHSSQIACMGFLPDDSRIVSIGGKDFSVMQWCLQ